MRALLRLHLANLQRDLGEGESDGVFLRSFSALHLAQIAARELRRPFLTEAEFGELVQGACRLLREERDRRGWVEGKGWVHPIAHSADLLAALARAPALALEHQDTMLDALEAGLAGPNAFGENERLAAVLAALVARPDFALAAFESRLGQWAQAAEAVWSAKPFDVTAFHKAENTKTLLRAVLLAILLDEQASEGQRRVADAIRRAFFAGGS